MMFEISRDIRMVVSTSEVQTLWPGVVAANVVSLRAKTIYGGTSATRLTNIPRTIL